MSQSPGFPACRRGLHPGPAPVDAVAAPGCAARPSSPVSIARCKTYDREVVYRQLQTMMDQLGGLAKLVNGKTVAVKVNLTGNPSQQACGLPASRTYHIHPDVVLATATLLDQAGARRIRFVECTYQNGPFEPYLRGAGWDLNALGALKAAVDYEDTHNLGKGKQYTEVKVPWGGSLFPAYHLNHSYVDCDVYISLAKLKNHATAGVTLGIKNNFGITPTSLYSHHKPNEKSTSARVAVFHTGQERPADGLPQEVDAEIAPAADVPGAAAHRRLGRDPADRPDDHRRDRDRLRRRRALAPGIGHPEAGPPAGRPQPGLHRLRRHGRHGLRPDGRAVRPGRSRGTTIWPWRPPSDWARTTPRRSRSWVCRSRKPGTHSAGNPASGTAESSPDFRSWQEASAISARLASRSYWEFSGSVGCASV